MATIRNPIKTIPSVEPITELSAAPGVAVICARSAEEPNSCAATSGWLNAEKIDAPTMIMMTTRARPKTRDGVIFLSVGIVSCLKNPLLISYMYFSLF